MLPKDFENYELRLRKLQESSREAYLGAKKIFEERYKTRLEGFFSGDALGTLARVRTIFCVQICEQGVPLQNPDIILQGAMKKACSLLPLSPESQNILYQSLHELMQQNDLQIDFYRRDPELSRDPIFPILENIFADGKISPEEMFLLERQYRVEKSVETLLTYLPEKSKGYIQSELGDLAILTLSERKQQFESQYSSDMSGLQKAGYQTDILMNFVSQSYYVPKKRFETRETRLKRTFKMALLRLLRYRFGNLDIENLLERCERCENFQDYFLLLYRLFEILGEDTEVQEVFHREEKKQKVKSLLQIVVERKKKILEGEQVTAKISDLVSKTDTVLESGVLAALLEDDTHFLGQEVHFAHTDTLAGVYAQSQELEAEDEEIEEITQGDNTLLGKYEALKNYFFELDACKRKAFATGDYDEIERLNDILFRLDSQMQKFAALLGLYDEEQAESGNI